MTDNGGWIYVFRKIMEWEWYHDSKMVHLFLHLIFMAQYKATTFRGIKLQRGQLLTGRAKLSSQTGLSEQSIRTCLDRLISSQEVTSKPTNRFSVITIVNYETYQKLQTASNQPANQQTTNKQPASNHIQVKKESNKVNKTTNNRPKDLHEMMDYCKTHLDWAITETKAREIWQYYCPPGGDDIWRDKKNAIVKNWHRRMVTCKKNDTGAYNGNRRTAPQSSQPAGQAGFDFASQESAYGEDLSTDVQ
jgi:hypothetical protein